MFASSLFKIKNTPSSPLLKEKLPSTKPNKIIPSVTLKIFSISFQ